MLSPARTFILVSIFATASAYDLIYSNFNGDIYVETGRQKYALTGSTLAGLNIDSIVVNGDSVTISAPTCQTTVSSFQSISGQLQKNVQNLRDEGLKTANRVAGSRVIDEDTHKLLRLAVSQDHSGSSEYMIGNMRSHYAKDSPISGLARIILGGPTVTYLYYSGDIDMKPIACLTDEERKYIGMTGDSNILCWGDSTIRELTLDEKEALTKKLEAGRQRIEYKLQRMNTKLARKSEERHQKLAEKQEQHQLKLARKAEERQQKLAEKQEQLQ